MPSMDEIKIVSSEFGRKVREFEDAGEKMKAYEAKSEWSYYRDSLSTEEKVVCVEAYTSANMPLSPAAQALLESHPKGEGLL